MGTNGHSTSHSTAELLAEFQRTGQQRLFEEIVRRYAAMVFSVCVSITKDPHDAEDATQATFLALAVQAKTAGGVRHIGPWLQQVAKRMSLDIRKSNHRRSNREKQHGVIADSNRRDALAENPIDQEELRQILRAELDQLPAKYRLPLILCYFGGLSHVQIASELGCRPNTLTVRLHRARQMLRESLDRRGLSINAEMLTLALTATIQWSVIRRLVGSTGRAAASIAAGNEVGVSVAAHVMEFAHAASFNAALSRFRYAAVALVLIVTAVAGAAGVSRIAPIKNLQFEITRPVKEILTPIIDRSLAPMVSKTGDDAVPPADPPPAIDAVAARPRIVAPRPAQPIDIGRHDRTPDAETHGTRIAGSNPAGQPAGVASKINRPASGDQRHPLPPESADDAVAASRGGGGAAAEESSTPAKPEKNDGVVANETRPPVPPSQTTPEVSPQFAETPAADDPVDEPTEIATGPGFVLRPGDPADLITRGNGGFVLSGSSVVANAGGGGAMQQTLPPQNVPPLRRSMVVDSVMNSGVADITGTAVVHRGSKSTSASRGITVGKTGKGELYVGNATTPGRVVETGQGEGASMIVAETASATGTVRGWGEIGLTGSLVNNGRVIADGYGQDRSLDISSFGQLLRTLPDRPQAGWYATNHGKLIFPSQQVVPEKSRYDFGDTVAGEQGSLVNSLAMNFENVRAPGELSVSLLSPDRQDVPELPLDQSLVGVWAIDAGTTLFDDATLAIRYDQNIIPSVLVNPQVQVWRFSGQGWELDDQVFTFSPNDLVVTSAYSGESFIGLSLVEGGILNASSNVYVAAVPLLQSFNFDPVTRAMPSRGSPNVTAGPPLNPTLTFTPLAPTFTFNVSPSFGPQPVTPEPGSAVLLAIAAGAMLVRRGRRQR